MNNKQLWGQGAQTDGRIHEGLRDMWTKIARGTRVFIETGTHHGFGLSTALSMDHFEKLFSVEIERELYKENTRRFSDYLDTTVFLSCESSDGWIKKLMPTIDERCMFWLDAHYPGPGDETPMKAELEAIKNHHIKDHIIVIDDIQIYFGDGSELREKCLEINPDYTVELCNSHGNGNQYILLAYIAGREEE